MTFEDHVRAIVDDFLQTVVVVDDEALPPATSEEAGVEAPSDSPVAPGGTAIGALNPPSGKNTDGHDLPAKEVIDAFALKGLVCSILDPDAAVQERLGNIAERADLLVMDWWIDGDRGGRAVELIESVLKRDAKRESRRLRVVAIYTGQDDLLQVADTLTKMLEGFYRGLKFDREPGALSMTKGPVRLTVFAKEHAKADVSGEVQNRVKVSELPDRLAAEFTYLAQGLISGAALHGLAAVRKDTHRILERLGPGLDRGYLGHRIAQIRPSDAEGHLTAMVAA
jgi:Response receiver domain